MYIIGKGCYNHNGIGSMLIMYCCQVNYSKTSHQIKTMDISPSHRPKIRNIKAGQLSEFGKQSLIRLSPNYQTGIQSAQNG